MQVLIKSVLFWTKEWCHENFLDFKNLKLAHEICKQLREICTRSGIQVSSSSDTVAIRTALISGFFMNAAEYQKDNEYKTVRNFLIKNLHLITQNF